MSGSSTAPSSTRKEQSGTQASRPRSRRLHRGPKGASVLDLIFKISSGDRWSATLRSSPTVVLVSDSGEELDRISHDLALAILQGRGEEKLQALREAGLALPEPEPVDEDLTGGPVREAAS
jgi:hypothetical protein